MSLQRALSCPDMSQLLEGLELQTQGPVSQDWSHLLRPQDRGLEPTQSPLEPTQPTQPPLQSELQATQPPLQPTRPPLENELETQIYKAPAEDDLQTQLYFAPGESQLATQTYVPGVLAPGESQLATQAYVPAVPKKVLKAGSRWRLGVLKKVLKGGRVEVDVVE